MRRLVVPFVLHKIAEERPQPGEAVARVHVMFDDVEGEIIEPAETPDTNRQQHANLKGWSFQDQQDRGDQADDQEQDAFEFDHAGISEVFHAR